MFSLSTDQKLLPLSILNIEFSSISEVFPIFGKTIVKMVKCTANEIFIKWVFNYLSSHNPKSKMPLEI